MHDWSVTLIFTQVRIWLAIVTQNQGTSHPPVVKLIEMVTLVPLLTEQGGAVQPGISTVVNLISSEPTHNQIHS